METITQNLSKYVSKAFNELNYGDYGNVIVSNRPDLCQFQCDDSFAAAKTNKKNPLTIAQDVANVLKQNKSVFKCADAVPPGFINLVLQDEFLWEYSSRLYNDLNWGIPVNEHKETIVLDYGGPNIAKPLHIGHLRSAIIGEALKRLLKYNGYTVISDIHLGDWGLQMGLVIAGYQEKYPKWSCFSKCFNPVRDNIPEINVDELNEIYPYASEKSKNHDDFRNIAKTITSELQNGHPGYIALWKKIRQASIVDLKKIYEALSVDFDYWYGESDAQGYIEELMTNLYDKGLIYESEGALVVDVCQESDKKSMPPVLIKKSDLANLYATTDLATIIQRRKDFKPNKIWYVVDARQELHFEQVFRCAQKANLVNDSIDMEFLGFGTMNGTDGKPYKTRDGGVMRLETFIEMVQDAARKQFENSNYGSHITEEEKNELSLKIAIAAIKFGDLMNHRSKNYVFDSEKFLSFEGKTGTYLLYTVSRINSLIKKVQGDKILFKESFSSFTPEERELILNLIYTGDIFVQAVENKAPNMICEQAYAVASAFSRVYQSCNIINESNPLRKETLISLTLLTRKYLTFYLNALGIEPVEHM